MFCAQCGKQVKQGQRFCTNCGATVEAAASPASRSSAASEEQPIKRTGSVPSGSSPAPSEIPAVVAALEIPGPIPVPPPQPLRNAAAPDVVRAASPRQGTNPRLLWGGIGVLVLAVVGIVTFLLWSVQPTVPDADIEKAIQLRFMADQNLKRCAIGVRSQSGIVTLAGYINDDSDRSTAMRIASQQRGVKKVVDFMRFTPTFQIPMGQRPAQSSTTTVTPAAGAGGGTLTAGTLRLFQPQIEASSRKVLINGVDTARPTTPFHFDWGDGSESVGFFPQMKIYRQAGTYTVNVVATYPDGSHGSAEKAVEVP